MVTENLQAGDWYDTDTARISFGFPVKADGLRVPFGRGAIFESVDRSLNTEFPGGTLTEASPQDWRINCDLKAVVGTRPRPSSNHSGGVNVIMASGAGRFLSDKIDPRVYVKLMTSRGGEYGEGELSPQDF